MKKGRVADDIHIRMLRDKSAQPLHGVGVGLWLAHIKRNLLFHIFPAVGHGIIHMHRVPHNVCQKTDRVTVERLRLVDRHVASCLIIRPLAG